jgi:phytoene dehydrogenase-like protein
VYGLVSKLREGRAKLRQVLQLPPAAGGRQPVLHHLDLHADRLPRAQVGRALPMGGTGALVKGLVKLIEARGARSAATPRCGASRRGRRATGVRAGQGRRALAADIVVSNADTAWTYRHLVAPEHRRRWTDTRIEKARYSMSLFVWYFGTNRQYPDVPHHTILLGPRYEGLLDRHLRAPGPGRRLQPVPAPPHRHRPGMAPEGCDASTCCRRCRTWTAAPTGRAGRGLPQAIEPKAWPHRAARPGAAHRHLARDHAAGLPRPLLSFKGAAFGWSRCCCRAPGSARTTAARTWRACTWWARAPTPVRACPAY